MKLFREIIKEATENPAMTAEAREFLRESVLALDVVPSIERVKFALEKRISIRRPGELYLYRYLPKGRNDLPYYDIYPVTMITNMSIDGKSFEGLNLHYLPPDERVELLNAIYFTLNNTAYDDTTRAMISYDILTRYRRRFMNFYPCYKKYLIKQVRSLYHYVPVKYWDIIALLPIQRFEKATDNRVWTDSLATIRRSRRK